MEELLNNPYTIAIVGGLVSTVVGGLILAVIPPGRSQAYYTSSRSLDGASCVVSLFKLLLLGLFNVITIAILFGPFAPSSEFIGFGIPGFDILIKAGIILVFDVALIAKLFYNIDLIR